MKSLVASHIRECYKQNVSFVSTADDKTVTSGVDKDAVSNKSNASYEEHEIDFFWNYKSGEFFFGSIFRLALNFEKYGHGVGMYVISKLMLPFLHSLKHSNYSNTIHRFICRVLTTTTPREALLLIWERFVNRNGEVGGNIFKDRKIEFRIRILKKLLRNLGPNLNSKSIQRINRIVDVKEKLYHQARKAQGVTLRKGAHKSRSDQKDYEAIFKNLTELKAHEIIPGRKFGSIQYPPNFLDYEKIDRSSFFRWITKKNKDFLTATKSCHSAIPSLT